MAFNDDSFIREVNEELRSDQMKGVWRRFGRYIIVVAILIVVGTAKARFSTSIGTTTVPPAPATSSWRR